MPRPAIERYDPYCMTRLERQEGRDPRTAPIYSAAEAAKVVRVPAATVRSWVKGRSHPRREGEAFFEPVIRPADPKLYRLSFQNLIELHVLSILRRQKDVPLANVRAAIEQMKSIFGTEHPLADVQTSTDCLDVYVEVFGEVLNATKGQFMLRPLIERYLDRIDRLAVRFFPFTRPRVETSPKWIVIDPRRRFGRPYLVGTGVETKDIIARHQAGESVADLARDFEIEPAAVEEALRFEAQIASAA